MLSRINKSAGSTYNKVICYVFVVFGLFAKIAPALASKVREQERHKVKEQIESPNFSNFSHVRYSFLPPLEPEFVGIHPWLSGELDKRLNPRFTSFLDNMEELVLPERSLAGYEFQRELEFGRIYDLGDVKFTDGLYSFNDASHPAPILNSSAYGRTPSWSNIKRDLFESNSQWNIYHPFIRNTQDFAYVYDLSDRLSIILKGRSVFNHLYSTENPLDIGFGSLSSMLRLSVQ